LFPGIFFFSSDVTVHILCLVECGMYVQLGEDGITCTLWTGVKSNCARMWLAQHAWLAGCPGHMRGVCGVHLQLRRQRVVLGL
jgi:hypothetical protein